MYISTLLAKILRLKKLFIVVGVFAVGITILVITTSISNKALALEAANNTKIASAEQSNIFNTNTGNNEENNTNPGLYKNALSTTNEETKFLPDWCPPSSDPGLAVICGTVVSSLFAPDIFNNMLPNVPRKGVTVSVFEDNPFSPTGKMSGNLTNLFTSTATNAHGQFRITMRRIGPPNQRIHLIYQCQGGLVAHKELDSWHNYYGMFEQVNCQLPPKAQIYLSPPSELSTTDITTFYGCTSDPQADQQVGLSNGQAPTVNNIITEENYDHRFGKNIFHIDGSLIQGGSDFGKGPLSGEIIAPGGLWEPDCLIRHGSYQCNVSASGCRWDIDGYKTQPIDHSNFAISEPHNRVTAGETPGYVDLGKRTGLCPQAPYYNGPQGKFKLGNEGGGGGGVPPATPMSVGENTVQYEDPGGEGTGGGTGGGETEHTDEMMLVGDYLTRPFFMFIPKKQSDLPFRRLDFRGDIKDLAVDPYANAQWICKIFGCPAGTSDSKPRIIMRSYLAKSPELEQTLIDCRELRKANSPVSNEHVPSRNFRINAGPASKMAPPTPNFANIYYKVGARFYDYACAIRDEKGAVVDKVRLCEIQTPFVSETKLCQVGDPSCKDNNIPGCGPFKLSMDYFPVKDVFGGGTGFTAYQTATTNDSMIAPPGSRNVAFALFNTESQDAHVGDLRYLTPEEPTKANSPETVAQILNPQFLNDKISGEDGANSTASAGGNSGGGEEENGLQIKSLVDILTYPNVDKKKEYIDNTSWNIGDYGSTQQSLCGLTDVYSQKINDVIEIANKAIQPNNLFKGNAYHVAGKAVDTATFYPSPDSKARDGKYLALRNAAGDLSALPPTYIYGKVFIQIPVPGVPGTTAGPFDISSLFSTMYARDVWDSLLTIMGGDAKLHDLKLSLGDLGAAIASTSITVKSAWKTYGDRDPSLPLPVLKPYYQVDYPLSEPVFKKLIKLPTENNPKTEYLPEDWTPDPQCYPWSNVQEDEMCGTYREWPDGASRTCRVDECLDFQRVKTRMCTCTRQESGGIKCRAGRIVPSVRTPECTKDSRIACAKEQETTKRCHSNNKCPDGHEDDPLVIWDPDNPCDDGATPQSTENSTTGAIGGCNPYIPPDPDPSVCNIDYVGGEGSVGGEPGSSASSPITTTGQKKHRCNMSVAGPMEGNGNGGFSCNAKLVIDDYAVRALEKNITGIGTNASIPVKPKLNLDLASMVTLIFNTYFRPPTFPMFDSSKYSQITAATTDEAGNIGDKYTQNRAKLEPGAGDYTSMAMWMTFPVGKVAGKQPMEPIYYNCDLMGSHTMSSGEIYEPKLELAVDAHSDANAIPGWQCVVHQPPATKDAKLVNSSGGCGMSSAKMSACANAIATMPKNPSETFRQVINTAANITQVPAAAIITIMTMETGFSGYFEGITDDKTVYDWSVPYYGRMRTVGGAATCSDLVWSAQGPFQWIQSWFNKNLDPDIHTKDDWLKKWNAGNGAFKGELCKALNKVSPGRCLTASRCNLLDAAIATGIALKPYGSCGSFNIEAAYLAYSGGSSALEIHPSYVEASLERKIFDACR